MRLSQLLSLSLVGIAGLTGYSSADVGVLDKYDCHKNQNTKEYHCHGPAHLAKVCGVILSTDARVQGWSTLDNKFFLFAGIGANVEFAHKWLAATASYFMMPMMNTVSGEIQAIDGIFQKGWESGIKFGPGVGRFGNKAYLTGGWSSSELTDNSDAANNGSLNGYYAGAGVGYNTQTLTFDVIATYRDPQPIVDYLSKTQGELYDVVSFDTRFSLGWRF